MPSAWKVTSQQETTETTPGVGFTRGFRVFFTTDVGNSGSVFVPAGQYAPDKVKALIAAAATTMDAVSSLTTAE